MKKLIFLALILLTIDVYYTTSSLKYELIKDTTLLTIIPLTIVYRKGKISEFGLRLNLTESIKYALSLLVLASPLIINAAHMPEFRAYYPIWRTNTLWEAIYFEVVVLSLLMFNNEFFFRGFFLFSLEKEIGRKAIIIHAFPYTLAHLGKPWLEIPYSFLAGLIFGYIALKTKSILPTFLTHWIGAATFDFLCY